MLNISDIISYSTVIFTSRVDAGLKMVVLNFEKAYSNILGVLTFFQTVVFLLILAYFSHINRSIWPVKTPKIRRNIKILFTFDCHKPKFRNENLNQ